MVFELLEVGAENARTGKQLCGLLNISIRELTEIIESERREGKPICASMGIKPGYFLAANKAEMQTYCKCLNSRASEIKKTRKACLNTIKDLPA